MLMGTPGDGLASRRLQDYNVSKQANNANASAAGNTWNASVRPRMLACHQPAYFLTLAPGY